MEIRNDEGDLEKRSCGDGGVDECWIEGDVDEREMGECIVVCRRNGRDRDILSIWEEFWIKENKSRVRCDLYYSLYSI